MYTLKDLFNQRSAFAARLEQFIDSYPITKTQLCKDAHISRPTLDKLLAAEITNETNFEKHAGKILDYFHVTPNKFMGNSQNRYNRIRQIKTGLHISNEDLSSACGISVDRLKAIESGESVDTAELRDIALCCNTSVRGLLGTNFFSATLSIPGDFVDSDILKGFGGLWGHIGILPSGQDKYLWYPIIFDVKNSVYSILEQKFIVIPCMNNKALFLNTSNTDNIVFLDEACDPPSFANWDSNVSQGEIPPVVYEALEDYYVYGDDMPRELISEKLQKILEKIVKSYKWTEDDIMSIAREITVHFKSGNQIHITADFDYDQNLTDAVTFVYDFGSIAAEDEMPYISDLDGTEMIINLNNISMIELPLAAVEDIICLSFDE